MNPGKALLENFDQLCFVTKSQLSRKLFSKDFARGRLKGLFDMCNWMISDLDLTNCFEERLPSEDDHKKYGIHETMYFTLDKVLKLEYFDEIIEFPLYNDDYGQCLATLIDNEIIGLGTYNLEYKAGILTLFLEKLYNHYVKEIDSIENIKN